MYVIQLASSDEIGEGMDTVSIVGQKAATPPATSPTHLFPLCQPSNPLEAKGVTSEELDKRLQDHLKTQATEWYDSVMSVEVPIGRGSDRPWTSLGFLTLDSQITAQTDLLPGLMLISSLSGLGGNCLPGCCHSGSAPWTLYLLTITPTTTPIPAPRVLLTLAYKRVKQQS